MVRGDRFEARKYLANEAVSASMSPTLAAVPTDVSARALLSGLSAVALSALEALCVKAGERFRRSEVPA